MGWKEDWTSWTQTTYGLIQAVHLFQRADGGNIQKLESVVGSSVGWSPSSLGFQSSVPRKRQTNGGIRVSDADQLVGQTTSSLAAMILINTAAITETLLGEILLTRGVVTTPPGLFEGIEHVKNRLSATALARHRWAVDGCHELRVIRNVIVHASGKWSQRSLDDLAQRIPAIAVPRLGSKLAISTDDVFAYRRAARTLLNQADR